MEKQDGIYNLYSSTHNHDVCEIAFETLDIIRITGLVYEANIASRKVLERNGFLLEGKMEKAVIKNNNIFDLCIYGKVR